ncbi:ammonium transporter [Parabacteroides sp. FAFU027]|uniref:ammonium transporter n=1 Tax=Parabacteroides sp. FAFU027 TaxID=2922715 RepID=UPI00397DDD86
MVRRFTKYIALPSALLAAIPALCMAQTADSTAVDSMKMAVAPVAAAVKPMVDAGDTAWMIVATAFVLLMTIPGLALFYGGLVRRKNVLNVLMQCFILTAVISLEWVAFGYSNAFGTSSIPALKPFFGGFDWSFLRGIKITDLSPYFISHSQPTGNIVNGAPEMIGTIPHIIFILFQCMFAVITPALIIGAFAERVKFKGFLVFSILWAVIVYNPVAHWVWSGDGWLFKMGALDFAGGTVVHINAGVAALIMAILVGKRKNYQGVPTTPHNIPMVAIGAGLLWFGWFGFNAGSGLAADSLAGSAFLATHIATAAAALGWTLLEWIFNKKPTIVGVCTGAVAGLVAITPAAGFVDVVGAMIIGFLVAAICFFMVAVVKAKLGYDDSLDAFGVHGIGGIFGAIITGVLANPAIQSAYSGAAFGNGHQLVVQLIATGSTILYTAVCTFILFKVTDAIVGVRATESEELQGLDITQHNELAYTEEE